MQHYTDNARAKKFGQVVFFLYFFNVNCYVPYLWLIITFRGHIQNSLIMEMSCQIYDHLIAGSGF